MRYTWKNVVTPAGDPQAFTVNPCWPSVLTGNMGYALLTEDPWYTSQNIVVGNDYRRNPSPRTQGVSRPRYKREIDIGHEHRH
jgi:hypothetical protein